MKARLGEGERMAKGRPVVRTGLSPRGQFGQNIGKVRMRGAKVKRSSKPKMRQIGFGFKSGKY